MHVIYKLGMLRFRRHGVAPAVGCESLMPNDIESAYLYRACTQCRGLKARFGFEQWPCMARAQAGGTPLRHTARVGHPPRNSTPILPSDYRGIYSIRGIDNSNTTPW